MLLNISCVQMTGESQNKDHMTNSSGCKVPEQINKYATDSVNFILAEVALWEGDYLNNSIHLLSDNGEVKRIKNTSLPEGNNLFDSDMQDFFQVENVKHQEFKKYLKQLLSKDVDDTYTTPENLKVSGGTNVYVYVHMGQEEKWICFEPESSDLLKEIRARFAQMFE